MVLSTTESTVHLIKMAAVTLAYIMSHHMSRLRHKTLYIATVDTKSHCRIAVSTEAIDDYVYSKVTI